MERLAEKRKEKVTCGAWVAWRKKEWGGKLLSLRSRGAQRVWSLKLEIGSTLTQNGPFGEKNSR